MLATHTGITADRTMPTRNITLTDQQHALVDSLVQTGRDQNASEVLRDGLRLVEARERIEQANLGALQQAAAQGWNDVAAGRCIDVAEAQLEDLIGQLGQQAAARLAAPGLSMRYRLSAAAQADVVDVLS